MPQKIEVELKNVASKSADVNINDDARVAQEIETELETVGTIIPPDGGYGWVIVLASFCLNIIVDGVVYTIGKPIQEKWVDAFSISNTSASLAVSILSSCYYFTGPLASILCDIYDCRRVAGLGAIIATFGYACSMFCPNIYSLYICFGIIVGIGYGLMYLPSIVVISQYFRKNRSLATGIAVCGSGIGTTLFAMINELVLNLFGGNWRALMLFLAVVSFSGLFFAALYKPVSPSAEQISQVTDIIKTYEATKPVDTEALLRPKTPFLDMLEDHEEIKNMSEDVSEIIEHDINEINRPMLQQAELCTIDPDSVQVESAPRTLVISVEKEPITFRQAAANLIDPSLFASASFILLAVSGLLTMIAFYVPFIYLKNHLDKLDGLSAFQTSLPVSMIGVINVAGRIACGRLSDHPKMSALMVSAFAITLGGFVTCLVPFFNAYWQFIAYTIPFSICVASFGALRSIIAVELVGVAKLNSAFGILMVFMGVGCLIGSPAAAALKDLTGNYDTSFYVMGVIMMVSGVMLVPLKNIRQKELCAK